MEAGRVKRLKGHLYSTDDERREVSRLLKIDSLQTYFFSAAGVVKAVDGISFDVNQGETIAIVGESGCGKSVSALSILRLVADPPGRIIGGSICFRDRDLLTLSDEEIREVRGKDIAMVFQEPMTSLNPVLTIGRQLTETMEQHLDTTRDQAVERAIELLGMVGISDPERRLRQYPHHFSGGMRQRVMIAMALCCEPKLIIADEPTTALDVTIQAQILDLLRRLQEERGMGMLFITHSLGIVAEIAHRVAVMYAGRIVEEAPVREIFRHPRHPYTIGLLASAPKLGEARRLKKLGGRLATIPGTVPDLAALPAGCAFAPRCRLAVEACRASPPPSIDIGGGHRSRCIRWMEL
jgi:oligopeptide/dipeptide ABC transporter ATP-binding protein